MSSLNNIFFDKIEEIFLNKSLPKKIAVAVSGGADSLALTLLLHEFCLAKKIKLFAITIDHKMRKTSLTEALELGKILHKKKISHEILAISAKKTPQKNIEANLRKVRYEMLLEFCKKNEIKYLFLGHHLGDVAENFLIRLFRGSGLDGLSTMAEVSTVNEIKLVRPLLDIEKDQLKNFLRAKKVKWFEDETNDDEKFLRNKIRKFFESFEEKNLIQKRIKNACDEIAEIRDEFDLAMLKHAKEVLEISDSSTICFLVNHKKFQALDERMALKILALVLMEVANQEYKPRLEKLKNFYSHLKNKQVKKRNFYGCMVEKKDEKNLIIYPEKNISHKGSARGKTLRTILKNIF